MGGHVIGKVDETHGVGWGERRGWGWAGGYSRAPLEQFGACGNILEG